jgi:putative flippase GtrA
MRILREIFFFGVGGGLGFLVDTAVLYSLLESFGPFWGRGCSFVAAVFATWLFNRSVTFKHRRSGLSSRNEFVVFLALMCIGGSVNYAVYAWLIASYQAVWANPVIGVAAGSLAGMVVNLATSRLALFRRQVGDGVESMRVEN